MPWRHVKDQDYGKIEFEPVPELLPRTSWSEVLEQVVRTSH